MGIPGTNPEVCLDLEGPGHRGDDAAEKRPEGIGSREIGRAEPPGKLAAVNCTAAGAAALKPKFTVWKRRRSLGPDADVLQAAAELDCVVARHN